MQDIFQKFQTLIQNDLKILDNEIFDEYLIIYFNDDHSENERLLLRKYSAFFEKVLSLEKFYKLNLSSLKREEKSLLKLLIDEQKKSDILSLNTKKRLDIILSKVKDYNIRKLLSELVSRNSSIEPDEIIGMIDKINSYDKIIELGITHLKLKKFITEENPKSLSEYFDKLYTLSQQSIRIINKEILEGGEDIHAIISTSSEDFINKVKYSYDKLSVKESFSTGYEQFDGPLKGGFQKQRIYVIVGLPGSGKSTILLNLATNFWKEMKEKKSKKKKVIYYITLENSIEETLVRFSSCLTGSSDVEHDLSILQKELEKYNDTELIIEYFRPRTIGPLEIINRIKEIENDDKEVVSVFIDYLGKMGYTSEWSNKLTEWERLGYISDDLKYIATSHDIPIITAHQFNRGAKDKGRKAGHDSMGGSWKIVENFDIIIYEYRGMDDGEYNGPKQIIEFSIKKNRFGASGMKIQLVIDFDTWTLYNPTAKLMGDIKQQQEESKGF